MSNGPQPRTCSTCQWWKNERAIPGAPIGAPHVGDCIETLWPIYQGVNDKGPVIGVGGYHNMTFPQSTCSKHRLALSILADLGPRPPAQQAETIEPLPKRGA